MLDCEHVREQVSAMRDGEEGDAASADAHVDSCRACRAWLADLDRVTSRHRVGIVRSPDVTGTALAEWDRQTAASSKHAPGWRSLLALAGTASILVSAPRLVTGLGWWVWEAEHAHHVREIAAVEIAVGVGFLLAARHPSRYSFGLLPVCAALAVILTGVVTVDVLAGNTVLVSEVVHVPLALGTVVLGVVRRRCGRDPDPGAQRPGPRSAPDQEIAA